jgi:tetratricopeptide (TPR) repeat protein
MARAFREELTMAVRVIEPQTRDDVRRSNLAAANAAMLKGNAAVAVKHYSEMLRLNPQDMDAQYGIANAYLGLNRFKEMASALEAVLARSPKGNSSAVYHQPGFAYVALGNESRAEAILAAECAAATMT